MKKIFQYLSILFLTTFSQIVLSQNQPSSGLRISLITCTPGEELYSIFGHTAIRLVDSTSLTDYTFNYGTFDFNDKDFYFKFMQGKLNYFLSVENTSDFIAFYQYCNRGITEQVLQANDSEKIKLKQFLFENLKEEHRYYQYDFFYDNCTTRPRDILINNLQPQPVLPNAMRLNTTFRNAIHQYLDKGQQPWSKLGIDILLGARTDKTMTTAEQQFLPDNLMTAVDSSKPNLVQQKNILYSAIKSETIPSIFTPNIIFWTIGILVIVLSFLPFIKGSKIMGFFDVILFSILGLLGIILVLMWVATDHIMTKDNFNLMWAHPFELLIPFSTYLSNKKQKNVLLFLLAINTLCVLSWFLIPQQLNIALFPIALLTAARLIKRIL